ncbi:PREDICTED: origin recognition complex subunit 3 isoform X2 [Polistes dominula]|uniref:Origin recognition complex subunit 3 n=1 Tax=Polistes dominula TaxID=743375 RepID=A0ABM1I699_POLDO|nr:PREDICTED: origin recognition complex subunit 3 isoform X2 [Polistes dominula]
MGDISVSKGVFPHKGSYKIGQKKAIRNNYDYSNELWYITYKEIWDMIQTKAECIRSNMISQLISDLQSFVLSVQSNSIDIFKNELPTAMLLTGVNIPDHSKIFQKIVHTLETLTLNVAILWSKDSNNIKSIVSDTVFQFMNKNGEDDEYEIKKAHCSMRALKLWYLTHCDQSDPLIIIIPDFESFSPNVLHDFILILSSYSDTIKFVLLFGIATTLHVVHRSLSYDATSKLKVKVLHMQTQIKSLADILEGTIFSTDIFFRLTGRAFQLLTDIFLFNDFSVDRFLQHYKLCTIHHFYGNNINSLCCQRKDIKSRISALTEEDIKDLKKLPSFEKYLKTYQQLDENNKLKDKKLMNLIETLLIQFHEYMTRFLTILKCLHTLVSTLPKEPLGKQLREVYTKTVYSSNVTESQEYRECLQLLNFLSKEELLTKLESIKMILENTMKEEEKYLLKEFHENLTTRINEIKDASLDVINNNNAEIISADQKLSRNQLKQKLFELSQNHKRSPYKQAQFDLINYLDREIFSVYLLNPTEIPMNEIFCYNDGNAVKQHIRGSVRGSIHMGLNDPQTYLQCGCCKLENEDAISTTLPDLSIIYKLHLESKKLINMYDWLQAFSTIVDPVEDTEEEREIDPKIQARFTRAVTDLQYLGFIKTSRLKTDHVKRLT